jgi:ATP-binding cassette subfamily F protein 3
VRILNGEITEYHGSIIKPKEYRIGYLPQEEIALGDSSILHATLKGQKEVIEIENKLAELHDALNAAQCSSRGFAETDWRFGTSL